MPRKRHPVSNKSLRLTIALGLGALTSISCSHDAPTRPGAATRIVAVEGSVQLGRVGTLLPLPLVVRADDGTRGTPNVPIEWRIASGAGELVSDRDGGPITVTNASGRASMFLRPTAPGTITVTASSPVVPGMVAGFNAFALAQPGVVIRIVPGFDCGDPSTFKGPDDSSDVTVPVGMVVEWVYADKAAFWPCSANIQSTQVPTGGAPLGATLGANERFQFVPNVAGTWVYVDAENGGRATLTAVAP
jgi:hypothetical protein